MTYCKSYCEANGISTSQLNEAQKTLHYVAENMKMDKSISEEGYKYFQQAIESLKAQSCEDAISRQIISDYVGSHIQEINTGYGDLNKHTNEILRMIVNYIDSMPPVTPKQRWIPVSERMPEDSELVLFSTKTDRVFEGRFFADNTDRQWYSFRDEAFAWNNVVTAWMPLPEPYKAESEDKE